MFQLCINIGKTRDCREGGVIVKKKKYMPLELEIVDDLDSVIITSELTPVDGGDNDSDWE